MNLELFVLGTGGSMPLPGRHLSSSLLRRDGSFFLFDCGEGTQISLRSLNLRWKKIDLILITHTHADHITGLPGLLMLSSQVERTDPLYIIGPPRIQEYVESSRRVLEMYINYDIIVKELPFSNLSQQVWRGDGFTIHSFALDHSRTCVGYYLVEDSRPGIFFPEKALAKKIPPGPQWSSLQSGKEITLPNGHIVHPSEVMGPPRRGRKFSYVTDSLPVDTIAEKVKNSDLLICEGMFTEEFRDAAQKKKHMTAKDAAFIARRAGGIKRMGLTHFSPRFTNGQLGKLVREAQEIFPASFCLRDKMHILIPFEE